MLAVSGSAVPAMDGPGMTAPASFPSRRHRGAHPTLSGGRVDFRAALHHLRTAAGADQRAAS